MGVLSVEESSKALIYHFAAEGVYRVVAKKPNHISTFTEKELLDHRFKHSFLASLFLDYLLYAPFYGALETIGRSRKTAIPKSDVRLLILQAIQGHRRLQVEMSGGGRAAKEVQRLFSLLQSLGAIKNRGLYVDHREGRVQSPRETPKEQLDDVLALAEGAIAMVEEASKRPYSVREKELQREENKRLLTAIRQARRRTLKGPTTPVATTDGAPRSTSRHERTDS